MVEVTNKEVMEVKKSIDKCNEHKHTATIGTGCKECDELYELGFMMFG